MLMTILEAFLTFAALLAVATVAGVAVRRRAVRIRRDVPHEVIQPERLGADGLGQSATLLQFSTEMCSRCPGVHRMLSSVAAGHDGVRHLDVDLTHRPDIRSEEHTSELQSLM